jgi:hypothetical protein
MKSSRAKNCRLARTTTVFGEFSRCCSEAVQKYPATRGSGPQCACPGGLCCEGAGVPRPPQRHRPEVLQALGRTGCRTQSAARGIGAFFGESQLAAGRQWVLSGAGAGAERGGGGWWGWGWWGHCLPYSCLVGWLSGRRGGGRTRSYRAGSAQGAKDRAASGSWVVQIRCKQTAPQQLPGNAGS